MPQRGVQKVSAGNCKQWLAGFKKVCAPSVPPTRQTGCFSQRRNGVAPCEL
jgi:hypothetical protein